MSYGLELTLDHFSHGLDYIVFIFQYLLTRTILLTIKITILISLVKPISEFNDRLRTEIVSATKQVVQLVGWDKLFAADRGAYPSFFFSTFDPPLFVYIKLLYFIVIFYICLKPVS